VAAPVRNDNNNNNKQIITVRNDTKRSTDEKVAKTRASLFASTTLLLGKTRSNTPIFATTRHLKCDTPIWFVPPGKQKKKKGSLIQIQNQSQRSEKRERRKCVPRGVEFHERALCSTIPTSKARRTSSRENKRSVFMHVISIIIGGKFDSKNVLD
jgi:hypothetical protein